MADPRQIVSSEEVLKGTEEYIDKVALAAMCELLRVKVPESDKDAAHLATVSHRVALAMLDVKQSLPTILTKSQFLMKQRKVILGNNE